MKLPASTTAANTLIPLDRFSPLVLMGLVTLRHESSDIYIILFASSLGNHVPSSSTKEQRMYAITGITGKVGGAVARTLLAAGRSVRAVARDREKVSGWAGRGCDIALADMQDAATLAAAFAGMEGVFVLLPPVFDPAPGFPESDAVIAALRSALLAARPGKVVCLSTIGAQATQENLLTQLQRMERALGDLPMPVTFLRPGWFMENAMWDVPSARDQGVVMSFLQPLDKAIPMVATADVGRVAAELLQQDGEGPRVVELEGPERVAPKDIAAAFDRVLGRPVHVEVVPRGTWEGLFRSQGMSHPEPRMRMLDGFNEGWIAFEGPADSVHKGHIRLEAVLRDVVQASA
ncbi:NmrA family NAD(P)-binding protein [Luteibacter sp. NPDC031894]|uniref:NmrA family NAD(P)-binding protein n=1 Tax=Luteibacter sp. NPDC031894 TaxID=3390572 RepID=UPI003CFCA35E